MSNYINNLIQKKRREFDALCREKSIPPSALEDVVEYLDIPYHVDNNPRHKMDIFRPAFVPGPLPVVINVHGGGLIMGNKEFNRHFCALLCGQGFLVCSMEYRLVPEVTMFRQLEDVYAAMDFLDVTVGQYGGQPGSVYMVGDSAGAFLIFYASALQCDPKLASAASIQPSMLPIDKIALISGMFYTAGMDSIGLLLSDSFYGKGYRKSSFYHYLDPGAMEVCNAVAPAMLITSDQDNLKRHTMRLSRALDRHHIPHCLRDYGSNPSLTHAFPVFSPELAQSRQAITEIAAFFRGEYDLLLEG